LLDGARRRSGGLQRPDDGGHLVVRLNGLGALTEGRYVGDIVRSADQSAVARVEVQVTK
jgi:hypothetical protein